MATMICYCDNCKKQIPQARLEALPNAVKLAKQSGNGIVIIGETVGDRTAWFENRPLHGWRVLVPRTKDSTEDLREQMISFGAVPFEVPTMSVEPPRTPQQMERAIHGLVSGRFEWVVFTSLNAVRAIRERFEEYGLQHVKPVNAPGVFHT